MPIWKVLDKDFDAEKTLSGIVSQGKTNLLEHESCEAVSRSGELGQLIVLSLFRVTP
jgi:hypothetical protein